MNPYSDPRKIGTIDFEIDIDDRVTTVSATIENLDGKTLTTIGQAKCRKEDHFDFDVGASIAGGRALEKLAKQIVADAEARVETEQQYSNRKAAEALRDIGAMFDRAIRSVASALTR